MFQINTDVDKTNIITTISKIGGNEMAFKVEQIVAAKRTPHWFAVKSYICDTQDDIAKLPKFNATGNQKLNDGEDMETNEPCYYGSSATVVEPYSGYVLNASNIWKQIF